MIRRLIHGVEHILAFKGQEELLGRGSPVMPSWKVLKLFNLDASLQTLGRGWRRGCAAYNFLLNTVGFPMHLFVLLCFRRHLSLVSGEKNPDPPLPAPPSRLSPGQRQRWDRILGGKRRELTACPFLFRLILFSSSCASIFIEGKRRKTDGNPRKAEHLVIIRVARLARARAGSRERGLTRSAALVPHLWVIGERSDVKHALNIAGRKGADGRLSLLLKGAERGARRLLLDGSVAGMG